jgi:indolepyruvate ferredoxin oxidoreductase beta subunit
VNETTVKVRPISVAVLAIGGEGGGVLADWIAGLAEQNGYIAQATSVPGVAQRTGATIYYIEMISAAKAAGRDPVLALMPVPGDVDVLIASELMEAARAVERGLVTPDRTTLIASTHRVYSMSERSALADGRVDSARLLEACRSAARRSVAFDMAAIADATNSAVNAVLFGALAGSGALPFPRMAFEATIRKAGVGVVASLAAFSAGFEAVSDPSAPVAAAPTVESNIDRGAAVGDLLRDFGTHATPESLELIRAGVARLIDYQDRDYARLYLERLRPIHQFELKQGDAGQPLLAETARQLALAMSYEDTIRVADLKVRRSRFDRVREEVKLADGQILEIAEFLHPRTEEIADTLPAGVGRWLMRTTWARRLVGRFTGRGRTVKTTGIHGFFMLYLVAALRPWRRRSLRYSAEQESIELWLAKIQQIAAQNYQLAVEVARMRGLVKGYGDTHAHGREKFDLLATQLARLVNDREGAVRLAEMYKAAIADESGEALRQLIEDVPSDGRVR